MIICTPTSSWCVSLRTQPNVVRCIGTPVLRHRNSLLWNLSMVCAIVSFELHIVVVQIPWYIRNVVEPSSPTLHSTRSPMRCDTLPLILSVCLWQYHSFYKSDTRCAVICQNIRYKRSSYTHHTRSCSRPGSCNIHNTLCYSAYCVRSASVWSIRAIARS